jgi:copper(I)-binding protein
VEAFAVIRRSGTTAARRLLKRRLLISAIALLIPALAGCEAGLNAPTLEFHPATNGAYGSAGNVTINNAFVLAGPVGVPVPAGGSAGLFVAFYNAGTASDRLLSASAPGLAASVKVSGGSVALPVNTSVNLMGPHPDIVLSGLTRTISGGQAYPIVFDFARGGTVTLMVPVEPHAFYYAPLAQPTTASPTPSPSASASGKSSPSASPSASASR